MGEYFVFCYNLDEFRGSYVKWNELDKKKRIVWFYRMWNIVKIYRDRILNGGDLYGSKEWGRM